MPARKPIPGAPTSEPWKPASWDPADVAAIQALVGGRATEDQQRRGMQWIIDAAGTYDLSFRDEAHGGARATDFAEGKRWVGTQIVKLAKIALGKLSKEPREQG